VIALRAAFSALGARHPWLMTAGGATLLVLGYALFVMAQTARFEVDTLHLPHGVVTEFSRPIFGTLRWVAAAVIAVATAGLLWRVNVERLLTWRGTGLAALLSAVFGAAWVAVLQASGVSWAAMMAPERVWLLSLTLLPLLATVLAPWSLSRVRHT
jgi:hypothetical protein